MVQIFKPLNLKALILAIAMASIGSAFFAVQASATTTEAATHHYIIQLKPSEQKEILTAISGLEDITPVLPKNPQFTETYTFTSTSSLEVLQNIFKNSYVYLAADESIGSGSFLAQAKINKFIPNDPAFTTDKNNIDKQWGLIKADFLKAWEKTSGKRAVVVAVIDTGIDATHEDFDGTHFIPGYNVLTDKGIRANINSDDNGHGTLIAGVIAATTNNKMGIAGAGSGLSLMPIKALNSSGSGSSSQISEGIVWAVDHDADVINLSLGGIGFAHDTVLANAITYAFNNNVVIVAAAGNDVAITGGNLDKEPVFPICNDNGQNMIIGVTATDSMDLKPSFANYGKACVDVSAPGKRILSTINYDPANGEKSPDSYAYVSGTSLAVPFVSAQAGLLRSLFPEASNKQIRNRIIFSAENINGLNLTQCAGQSCQGLLGGGRINAAKSLETEIVDINDGDVVQDADTLNYYLINGGKRQPISTFVKNQRFADAKIKQVSLLEVRDFPEGSFAEPLDGTLVKSAYDSTIYYMQSGLRRPLTYQVFTLRGFNFNDVVLFYSGEVASWIEGSFLTPPDNTLIRSKTNPTIYWVVNGILHPVNGKFFVDKGLNTLPLIYATENDIRSFPLGDAYIL